MSWHGFGMPANANCSSLIFGIPINTKYPQVDGLLVFQTSIVYQDTANPSTKAGFLYQLHTKPVSQSLGMPNLAEHTKGRRRALVDS